MILEINYDKKIIYLKDKVNINKLFELLNEQFKDISEWEITSNSYDIDNNINIDNNIIAGDGTYGNISYNNGSNIGLVNNSAYTTSNMIKS